MRPCRAFLTFPVRIASFSTASIATNLPMFARRDRASCKFWLEPVELAANYGLTARDLTAIRRIILEHHSQILESWGEHCGEANE